MSSTSNDGSSSSLSPGSEGLNPTPGVRRLSVNAAALIGPWIVGGLILAIFAGATFLCAARYFYKYTRDGLFPKLTVAMLALLCLFNYCMIISIAYFFAVDARDDDQKLLLRPILVFIPVITVPLTGCLSQLFFARRAYELSRKDNRLAFVLGLLILGSVSIGLVSSIDTFNRPFIPIGSPALRFIPNLGPPPKDHGTAFVEAYFWMAAATDLIITGYLATKLWKSLYQVKNLHRDTAKIGKLLQLSLTTGAVSSIFAAVAGIVIHFQAGESNAGFVFTLVVPFIYALVVIGTLNIRTSTSSSAPNSSPSSQRGLLPLHSTPSSLPPAPKPGDTFAPVSDPHVNPFTFDGGGSYAFGVESAQGMLEERPGEKEKEKGSNGMSRDIILPIQVKVDLPKGRR